MNDDSSIQRISRLTPLNDVLALIDRKVVPIEPHQSNSPLLVGPVLAQDVVPSQLPPRPIALRDGYAVEAAATSDASAYAPLPFLAPPQRIDSGEPLPPGTDAVMPLDAVRFCGDGIEAVAAVAPGEGVLAAGGDATSRDPLRHAGEHLRWLDRAVILAAGIENVSIRLPRICIARGDAATSPHVDAVHNMVLNVLCDPGCWTMDVQEGKRLDQALSDGDADAVIVIGGTGSGRHDASVRTLARLGRVEVRGIAITPGETAAVGFANTKFEPIGETPVLLLPGRLDAALTAALLIGRPLVARLAGGRVEDVQTMLPLKRKIVSTIGLTELIPVRCAGGMAEPLAAGYLSLTALARSDGWVVVPADSEGFAAGTPVAVRPWP